MFRDLSSAPRQSFALVALTALVSATATVPGFAAPADQDVREPRHKAVRPANDAASHQTCPLTTGPRVGTLPTTTATFVARPFAVGGIASACGALSFTQSSGSVITPLNTAQCFEDLPGGIVTTENGLARLFTAPQSLHIRCVTFGVQSNVGGEWPVQARVWLGDSVVAESDPVSIPANSGPALFTANFPGFFAIPAGASYVVELLVPSRLQSDGGDGGSLFLGSNSLGQSGSTFLRAPHCGINKFVDLATLGFPGVHLVMTLEADVPMQSLVAFGFQHTASGDIVERKDANGKVTIWHAAAPSAGSVAIELGTLPGPMGVTIDGSFATGSPNSTITWTPIAGFNGLPEGPVGTTRFHTDDGTQGTIQVDYSMLGTAAQTVRLFDADGAPIADFAWGNNAPIGVSAPPEGFAYSCRALEEIDIKWPVPVQVSLGSATMNAASMRIAVKAPAFTPSYLSALILSTENDSSVPAAPLEISAMQIDQFGFGIATGNDATVIDAGVTPGGTTGLTFGADSGPAVLIAKQYDKSTPKLLEKCVGAFVIDLDAPSLDQPGLELTATVADSPGFDETPNASSLTLHRVSSFFDIFVDFTDIGSPTHHVQILSNHVVVGDLPGLSGPVGSMSLPPKKIGKLGGQTECFTMCTDSATAFSVAGQVFIGDEIRILAEGGAAAECKDVLTLSATNAPAGVTVTGASTSPKLPPWIVKFGNAHGLVGSPIVACDDVLYVWRDIGDAGFNGVSLEVPGVDGASVTFEVPTNTVGAVHEVTVRGVQDADLVDETFRLSVEPDNEVIVSLDVHLASAATVKAIRNGQTVLSIPTVLPTVPVEIVRWERTDYCLICTVHPVWAAKECKDQVSVDSVVSMDFAAIGGGTVLADTVVVVRATNDPPSITSVELTGNACTPNSVISHESIDKLGWTFTGLGHAQLDATQSGALTVACCLGSSGQDGVEVDLGCASFFDIFVELPDWTEPNTTLTLQGVAGDFAGQVGGGTTGSLTFVRGAFFDVFADFSDIGTDTKHVIVKNAQGIPVFQTVTSDLYIGQLSSAPFKLGKLGGATPCYRACMSDGTQFTFGPITVDAHEIEILAVGGSDALCKSAARLTGTGNLGPIYLTGVVTQTACLGDFDGDGQVGGSDLAILLGAWGTGSGDLTGDGTTDAADLATLLGAWGGC